LYVLSFATNKNISVNKESITLSTIPDFCPQAGRASSPQSRVLGTQRWLSIQFTKRQPWDPRWSRLLMRLLVVFSFIIAEISA
jgi:hypothetical protein